MGVYSTLLYDDEGLKGWAPVFWYFLIFSSAVFMFRKLKDEDEIQVTR